MLALGVAVATATAASAIAQALPNQRLSDRRDAETGIVTARVPSSTASLTRFGPWRVVLDTSPFLHQRVQVYVRFVPRTQGGDGAPLAVRWWTRHAVLASGEGVAEERRLIFDGIMPAKALEEIFAVEVRAPSAISRPVTLGVAFEVELKGVPLPMPLWQTASGEAAFMAELQPAASTPTWTRQSDPAPPPNAIANALQPSSRGIRLQADWAGHRVALNPEVSVQNAFSLGGLLASTLWQGAAGLQFVLGAEKREFVMNGGWQLGARNRLLVTAAQLRQRLTLPFEAGAQDVSVTQYAGGIGYQTATNSRFLERLDFNVHASRSASQDRRRH